MLFSDRRQNANSSQTRLLKGITEPQDLKQVIEAPRRITDHSESLINLCFTNAQHKVIECDVVNPGLIDHSLIYCLEERSLPNPT